MGKDFEKMSQQMFQMMFEHLFYAKLNKETVNGNMSETHKLKTLKTLEVFKRHNVGIMDALEIISELGDVLGE